MFLNKTAWFSQSCGPEPSKLWVQGQGQLIDSSLAQFIFSDDWDHEDTSKFSKSQAYLKQHLAVFKSSYVLDAFRDDVQNVPLGMYLLIPTNIQKRLKSGITEEYLGSSEESSDEEEEETNARGKRSSTSQDRSRPQEDSSRLPQTADPSARSIRVTFPPQSKTHQASQSKAHRVTNLGGGDAIVPNGSISSPVKPSGARDVTGGTRQTPVRDINGSSNSRSGMVLPNARNGHRALSEKVSDRDMLEGASLANMPHIDDLPKVSGVLRTIDPKSDGSVMRCKR